MSKTLKQLVAMVVCVMMLAGVVSVQAFATTDQKALEALDALDKYNEGMWEFIFNGEIERMNELQKAMDELDKKEQEFADAVTKNKEAEGKAQQDLEKYEDGMWDVAIDGFIERGKKLQKAKEELRKKDQEFADAVTKNKEAESKAREALEKYNDGMWQYIFNGEVQSPKELR